MLADGVGLTSGLSAVRSCPEVIHDRGAVLRDGAVSIADGAQKLAGTAVLRDQGQFFGAAASVPTMWRSLGEIDQRGIAEVMGVRGKVRQRVWGVDRDPPRRDPGVAGLLRDLGAVVAVQVDASLVGSHSDKQCAVGNFIGGYGFRPLMAWCDNTVELLTAMCRVGNAGSNTAVDHIAIIDAAIAAIPTQPVDNHRRLGLQPRRGRARGETQRSPGRIGGLFGWVQPQ